MIRHRRPRRKASRSQLAAIQLCSSCVQPSAASGSRPSLPCRKTWGTSTARYLRQPPASCIGDALQASPASAYSRPVRAIGSPDCSAAMFRDGSLRHGHTASRRPDCALRPSGPLCSFSGQPSAASGSRPSLPCRKTWGTSTARYLRQPPASCIGDALQASTRLGHSADPCVQSA